MAMTLTPVAPSVPKKVGGIATTSGSETKSLQDVLNKLGFKELVKSSPDTLKLQLAFIRLLLDTNNPPEKNKIEAELCKQLNKNDSKFYLDVDPVKKLLDSLSISTALILAGSSISTSKVDEETQGKVSNLLNLIPRDNEFAKKKARDINNAIRDLNTPKDS